MRREKNMRAHHLTCDDEKRKEKEEGEICIELE
jgi:hypothetical protein